MPWSRQELNQLSIAAYARPTRRHHDPKHRILGPLDSQKRVLVYRYMMLEHWRQHQRTLPYSSSRRLVSTFESGPGVLCAPSTVLAGSWLSWLSRRGVGAMHGGVWALVGIPPAIPSYPIPITSHHTTPLHGAPIF